jgi:hypothetical protein
LLDLAVGVIRNQPWPFIMYVLQTDGLKRATKAGIERIKNDIILKALQVSFDYA